MNIHPTAIIDAKATLGNGVTIGPYCVVGAQASLGEGVTLHSHVVVEGHTKIGAEVKIFPFATIGHQPQDLKFNGESSSIHIGANTVLREHVTVHPGTEGGGGVTKIGADCLLMVGAHVAHDCVLGNHIIMANNATLAGHVQVGDYAVLGGLSAVHQFVRIGKYAMIGGMSGVENDVIPFGTVTGERARLSGLNLLGLKRHGFNKGELNALRAAYKVVFSKEGNLATRVAQVQSNAAEHATVHDMLAFLQAESDRPLCLPK